MTKVTIGMDLGDKNHEVCVLNKDGCVIDRFSVGNTQKQLQKIFPQYKGALVAMETGTHSPWISRYLESIGCKVLVGHARKLRAIWDTDQKSDVKDAEMLARIARLDKALLHPIQHRSAQAQIDLEQIKARDTLVRTRSALINYVRTAVKAIGERLPTCGADCFHKRAEVAMPDALRKALMPIVQQIQSITVKIREYDCSIDLLATKNYPETNVLRQVHGVGTLTALTFILTCESPDRFDTSRAVGPYLGLTPRKDQSGSVDKQLPISKRGNIYLRRLLVNCAQYILGHFGEDCDLRRYGERLKERGGGGDKRKAVVAVARKLAVLLHRLWATGEVYQPLYTNKAT